ncbi:hypothetical protein L0F63_006067 [Massospora cicadina]|nr:hypothetical protein L0F63_006067 [Massospora cicadina]
MRLAYAPLCGIALGCGIAVHIEVTHRALMNMPSRYHNYHAAIQRNLPAVEAGSFFPDWGYNCFKMGEASEAAHWPTFYAHAVKYIRTKYAEQLGAVKRGIPAGKEFERLLAFLFGVVSHGTADITWHSGKQDWEGDYAKAHTVADVGGVVHPLEDLAAIYAQMGVRKVTKAKLATCMALGFSGAHGVRIGGKRLLGQFDTDNSPFLVMNYESYFRGGVMNMASWVGFCWGELVEWLELDNKVGFCNLQFPNYADISSLHPYPQLKRDAKGRRVGEEHANVTRLILEQLDTKVKAQSRSEPKCTNLPYRINKTSLTLPHITPYALFGSTILSHNRSLLISAPYHSGTGAVFVYNLPHLELVATLMGPTSYATESRFGEDLALLDYDGDGVDDVLVGAPSYSTHHKIHSGAIHVYANYVKINSIAPPLRMQSQANPNGFLLFGERLLVADVNGDSKSDLVVGSPGFSQVGLEQSGIVCTYLASPKGGLLDEPDWCAQSPSPHSYERFAAHLQFLPTKRTLLVGAPGHRQDSKRVGCVYSLHLNPDGHPQFPVIPIVVGNQAGMQLGTRFMYSEGQLIVSAPTLTTQANWLAGGVYRLNLSRFDQPLTLDQPPIVSQSNGGLMGATLQQVSHPKLGGVFVGEPLANWERGQVRFLRNHQTSCFRSMWSEVGSGGR